MVEFLGRAVDRLMSEDLVDDDMAFDMECALESISDRNPEQQTRYFLEHSRDGDYQLAERLMGADNLDQSAMLMADVFVAVMLDNPHLLDDPDEDSELDERCVESYDKHSALLR